MLIYLVAFLDLFIVKLGVITFVLGGTYLFQNLNKPLYMYPFLKRIKQHFYIGDIFNIYYPYFVVIIVIYCDYFYILNFAIHQVFFSIGKLGTKNPL